MSRRRRLTLNEPRVIPGLAEALARVRDSSPHIVTVSRRHGMSAVPVPPFDHSLVSYGYAPGGYFCACFPCGERFIGDKRATTCQPCAIAVKERVERERQEGVQRLRDYVDGLLGPLNEIS